MERVFNGREYDAASEYLAEDVVQHGPVGELLEGIDAILGMLTRNHEGFSDLEAVQEECIAEGDTVACRYTYRGTHDGEFMGVEPTGQSVEISGTTTIHFEDGKFTHIWVDADMLGVLQQVGAFPAN